MANNGGSKTAIEPESVRTIAGRMGQLMDDRSPFEQLCSVQTLAGNFTTATWLQALLSERKDLLASHANELDKLMREVEAGLLKATANLEQTDNDNADALSRP